MSLKFNTYNFDCDESEFKKQVENRDAYQRQKNEQKEKRDAKKEADKNYYFTYKKPVLQFIKNHKEFNKKFEYELYYYYKKERQRHDARNEIFILSIEEILNFFHYVLFKLLKLTAMRENYNITKEDIKEQIKIFSDKINNGPTSTILYNEKTRIFKNNDKECPQHLKAFKLEYTSDSESEEDERNELNHINEIIKHLSQN